MYKNIKLTILSLLFLIISSDYMYAKIKIKDKKKTKNNLELKTDIEKKICTIYNLPLHILNKHIEGWILILGELLPRFIDINRIKSQFMSTNNKLKK